MSTLAESIPTVPFATRAQMLFSFGGNPEGGTLTGEELGFPWVRQLVPDPAALGGRKRKHQSILIRPQGTLLHSTPSVTGSGVALTLVLTPTPPFSLSGQEVQGNRKPGFIKSHTFRAGQEHSICEAETTERKGSEGPTRSVVNRSVQGPPEGIQTALPKIHTALAS